MSAIGFGKIVEKVAEGTSQKILAEKALELEAKTVDKKVTELESKELGKKVGEIEAKSAGKLTEETLKLSKEALSQGKLGKILKLNFVDETGKIGAKTLEAVSKRNPVAVITEANSRYVNKTPELIKLKYKYMAESPIAFYRSTGYLFYSDIAAEKSLATKVKIPIQGDLHLENIGTYKTSSNKIAFGLNDFDDSFVGNYTWDLARMGTSIRLAAKDTGLSDKEGRKLVEDYVKDYLKDLAKLEEKPGKLEKPLTDNKHFDKHIEKTIEKASDTSQKDFIKGFVSDGKFKITDKVEAISDKTKNEIKDAVSLYAKGRPEPAGFFDIKDSAFLISGKGSLGRNRYIVLLEGTGKGKANEVILELKEAVQPASAKAVGSVPGNQAERVINATKYFSPDADPYLGVTNIKGTDYFVRELTPASQRVELAKLNTEKELQNHIEAVALVTARAHALSGQTGQILDDAGSKAGLAERIGNFSEKYMEQVKQDFKEFLKSQ